MVNRIALPILWLTLAPVFCFATEADQIISGGRLYDTWWVDTNLEKPEASHPAYPKSGHKKRSTTWRCKECHGWDYNGKDGAYKDGSHFTGIKGIRDLAGANTDKLLAVLKDSNHHYDKVLPDSALDSIALFVSKGQVNTDDFIDPASKKGKGNPTSGKKVFEDNCQRCHGNKGTDFGLATNTGIKKYMGDVSNEDPFETLHKIRFGHPGTKMGMSQMQGSGHTSHENHHDNFSMGEAMPPMYGKLSKEQVADLLSYIQTLPRADSISIF